MTTVDQIEKSVYDAQAMKWYYTQSTTRAKKIKDYIKLASKHGNTRFIQQLLGHGLFTSIEIEKRKATSTELRHGKEGNDSFPIEALCSVRSCSKEVFGNHQERSQGKRF